MNDLPDPTHVTTGGAPGLDCFAARYALHLWPLAEHHVITPHASYDTVGVQWLASQGATVTQAPAATTPALAYRYRNAAMLEPHEETELIACLRSPEFYRSGEWMTVNIAYKARVPVRMVMLQPHPGRETAASALYEELRSLDEVKLRERWEKAQPVLELLAPDRYPRQHMIAEIIEAELRDV